MIDSAAQGASTRFLVGIDLGTTNSAVAYVDTAEGTWRVRDFSIPQLVGAGEVEGRETLPSFLYESAPGEFAPGALQLPWGGAGPRDIVGMFARDHGAAVPGRLVVSAKSWLSHSGVDRTAPLLPWHGAGDVQKLSPVAVSARYLGHIRSAWDFSFPEHPLAQQEVVLTVPASFDEVAREMTVQAARDAGLVRVVLVEEPQAAFYAWISAQGAAWDQRVRPGQKILICDVGGGTSDFTLIRVRKTGDDRQECLSHRGKVLFHRVAVGEHLILGGDNLDLALAHHVEAKLTNGGRLEPGQFGPLVRICRAAKETLVGRDAPETVTINIPGSGSKLIGGSLRIELSREEAQRVLVDGFLPRVPLDAKPMTRRSGFQEFGLPYAPDAAITRYLAAFLTAHRRDAGEDVAPAAAEHDPARPDLVLFNGGLFESPVLRERLLEVLESWFAGGEQKSGRSWAGRHVDAKTKGTEETLETTDRNACATAEETGDPSRVGSAHRAIGDTETTDRNVCATKNAETGGGTAEATSPTEEEGPWHVRVLRNDRLDLAVARGAAYYAMVRRGKGVRISGGLAHTYYVGVQTGADRAATATALCLLPAGVEEGHTIDLTERTFDLLIRQPAEFPLYYSATRTTDKPGALLPVDSEQMTALPPIRTVLQSGRRSGADTVPVHLHARLTEIGTLQMWCSEVKGERQWQLQFDVRAATRADATRHAGAAEAEGFVEERTLGECLDLIRAAFRKNASGTTDPPAGVVKRLEAATDMSRHDWPASLMRGFWETLMEVEAGRRLSVEHEARWLNLAGFCLRPGYGLAVDDWRVAQMWRLYPAGVSFAKNELIRAEWWILWRRLAGGLSAGQQATLADPLIADWRTWIRKSGSGVKGRSPLFQFGPHESAEVWRLLGSLELLKPSAKGEIAGIVLERLAREKLPAVREALLFCIGRLGARVPVYGPLNALIDVAEAEQWARRLMTLSLTEERASFALVQLTRRTGDRHRDVSDDVRRDAIEWLTRRGAPEHQLDLVRTGGELREEEQRSVFGETLPRGLRIE